MTVLDLAKVLRNDTLLIIHLWHPPNGRHRAIVTQERLLSNAYCPQGGWVKRQVKPETVERIRPQASGDIDGERLTGIDDFPLDTHFAGCGIIERLLSRHKGHGRNHQEVHQGFGPRRSFPRRHLDGILSRP